MNNGYTFMEAFLSFRNRFDQQYDLNGPTSNFIAAFGHVSIWGTLISRVWFHNTQRKFDHFLWYLLFITTFASRFSTGTRGSIVILILGVVLTDLWFSKKTDPKLFRDQSKFYLIVFLVSAFLMIFLTFNRMNKFDSIESAFTQSMLLGNDNTKILNDGSITANKDIGFCINNYLDNPQYFSGVYAQLVNPIPRMLWSDKPPVFGRILANEAHRSSLEGRNVYGWAAGIPGEAIFNAGYIGLIIFPFLFGIFFRKVGDIVNNSNNLLSVTTALLFMSGTYALIRGDWFWGINYPIYNSLFAIGVLLSIRGWQKFFTFKTAKTQEVGFENTN